MDTDQIRTNRDEIIQQWGEWTAHVIQLEDEVFTYRRSHFKFGDLLLGYGSHLQRIVQIVSDITNQSLNSLRVLDLACLEGGYGIELARHGAEVVGIEVREANIAKARFVQHVLGLDNLSLVKDDVRNISVEKYGHFDVVLCLGILYHLDAPDVFHFLEKVAEICRRLAIIDTHVSIAPRKSYVHNQRTYSGWRFIEHSSDATEEMKRGSLWASIDNSSSFWLTRPSLFNLLAESGFTSVYTCHNPVVPGQWTDRDTLLAVKGVREKLFSTPRLNEMPRRRWTEKSKVGLYPGQRSVPWHIGTTILRKGLNFFRNLGL